MQIFILVLRTYPASCRVIAQKLQEEVGFQVRFSGPAIENRARNVITHRRLHLTSNNFGPLNMYFKPNFSYADLCYLSIIFSLLFIHI